MFAFITLGLCMMACNNCVRALRIDGEGVANIDVLVVTSGTESQESWRMGGQVCEASDSLVTIEESWCPHCSASYTTDAHCEQCDGCFTKQALVTAHIAPSWHGQEPKDAMPNSSPNQSLLHDPTSFQTQPQTMLHQHATTTYHVSEIGLWQTRSQYEYSLYCFMTRNLTRSKNDMPLLIWHKVLMRKHRKCYISVP